MLACHFGKFTKDIKGTDIVGIYIFGAEDAYVVTAERIEKLLNVDEPKECQFSNSYKNGAVSL